MRAPLVLGLTLLAAGCVPPPTRNDLVGQTQGAAIAACRFEPTAASILQILALNNPALGAADQIAQAICAVIDQRTVTGGRVAGPPMVEGVPITGRHVDPV